MNRKCRSRHQGWVVAIALAGTGCADGAEPGAPRAPTGGRMRSIDANTLEVPDHGRLVYARPWAGASAFAGGTAATATAGLWNSLFE